MTPDLPAQFFKYAVAIGLAAVGLQLIDQVDHRLGTLYVIVLLLGVALTQRQGVLAFTSWLQSQTQGLSGG
jgi:DMSO/TMAO reductase YedYZ heme-binding membrane subunit